MLISGLDTLAALECQDAQRLWSSVTHLVMNAVWHGSQYLLHHASGGVEDLCLAE